MAGAATFFGRSSPTQKPRHPPGTPLAGGLADSAPTTHGLQNGATAGRSYPAVVLLSKGSGQPPGRNGQALEIAARYWSGMVDARLITEFLKHREPWKSAVGGGGRNAEGVEHDRPGALPVLDRESQGGCQPLNPGSTPSEDGIRDLRSELTLV